MYLKFYLCYLKNITMRNTNTFFLVGHTETNTWLSKQQYRFTSDVIFRLPRYIFTRKLIHILNPFIFVTHVYKIYTLISR